MLTKPYARVRSMFSVEHIVYRHGNKDEDETAFETEQAAHDFARQCFRYGGRVWVNGTEVKKADLLPETPHAPI